MRARLFRNEYVYYNTLEIHTNFSVHTLEAILTRENARVWVTTIDMFDDIAISREETPGAPYVLWARRPLWFSPLMSYLAEMGITFTYRQQRYSISNRAHNGDPMKGTSDDT